tara:strand:- start:188 stop:445 length:258 start_codon:yes stop_codon:yes gene_type:complete
VEDDKLACVYPVERVEAYHEHDSIAWAHADHKQRECTYDEWLKKYMTFLATGFATCTRACYMHMHMHVHARSISFILYLAGVLGL